jgi:transcription initiation factor TFIIF subunit alpha
MAPPNPAAAKLFHPKTKKKGPVGIYGMHPRSASPQKPQTPPNPSTPPTKPSPKPEPETAPPSLPEGPYTDYTLVSSALNGWKYDVMKFDSRKPVDILRWSAPVKLNRKDLRRPDNSVTGPEAPKAVGPMLGPDGKPVIGMDGRIVMVDAEGKPIHGDSTSGGAKNKNGAPVKRKFQKKTKQVFKVPEATRQLRKEERYPWVMEDATGTEVWVGKMEEVSKAETQAFFMPASNNTFKFVPAHRWYKFQKKPNYHIPNLEEAESLVCKYIFYVFPASTFAQDGHEAEEQGSRTMASTETWRERSLRSDLCLVEGGVTGEFCQRREFRSRR